MSFLLAQHGNPMPLNEFALHPIIRNSVHRQRRPARYASSMPRWF